MDKLTYTLSNTHPHTHTHTIAPSHTLKQTNKDWISHSELSGIIDSMNFKTHTHTLTHTHTYTHTNTHTLTQIKSSYSNEHLQYYSPLFLSILIWKKMYV